MLGVLLAQEKTKRPVLVYLGIEIDSVCQLCRLPQDKLQKLVGFISLVLAKKKVTLHELQQLAGHLNFKSLLHLEGRLSIVSVMLWWVFVSQITGHRLP